LTAFILRRSYFSAHRQGARSDVDILVVCSFSGKRRHLMLEMDRALRGLNLARDIMILTPEEFELDRHIPGTIARPAWKEGRVLYESAQ